MSRWPKKSLGEVAKFINGYPFKPTDWSANGLPIIRIQNLTNPTAPANRYNGTFDKRYAVHDGDLLVSWSATLDVFVWNGGSAILNQHIFLVVPDLSQVSKTYLFYALKSVMDELRSQTHGATMKHITKGPFERTQIPVPPLSEQERIVKLLDEADELRKLRTKADERTDALIPALFHEMFGDPATNSKNFPTKPLGEVADTTSGGTPDRKRPDYYGGNIPWVKSGELHDYEVSDSEEKITQLGLENSSAKLMPPGTILLAMYGATVGAMSRSGFISCCK